MKYIILWALLNIHNGDITGPYMAKPYHEWTAEQCTKILLDLGAQKPDKDGQIKIFECVAPGRRSTVQSVDWL